MKALRFAVVIGLLMGTAVVSVVPAQATHTYVPPIDRSPLPKLAGDTTVVGNETAWMRVRLPNDIRSEKIGWLDLNVKGSGRLFGMLLVQEIAGEVDKNNPSLDFLRSGMCNTRGCKPQPHSMISGGGRMNREGELPAGIYRLYLMTDGGRVEVHFSTPDLPGVVRLNPTTPARAKVHNLTPRVSTGEAGIIHSAGDKRPFKGMGFAFQAQWVDPMGAGVVRRDMCVYYKEAVPVDQTTAYIPPQCPVSVWWELLTLTSSVYTPETYSDGYWEMHLGANFLPKAMGSYYALTSPAEHYGAAALWLKVD